MNDARTARLTTPVGRSTLSFQQEIDLLELGHAVARCLHGENVVGNEAERVSRVAGRAYRARVAARRLWFERTYGGRTPWRTEADRVAVRA